MAKYNKLLMVALLGGFSLGVSACGDKTTGDTDAITSDGDCDPALDGDPDCERDGICNTDDAEDPDCEFCDYNPEDEDCIDWFEPSQVDVDGTFAFDPAAGNAVAYKFEGDDIPPEIVMVIYDARYADTQAPEYVCALTLTPSSPAGVDWHDFKATLSGGEVSYRHYGMTMKKGEFDVLDNTLGGQVDGCLQKDLRPSVWGADLAATIKLQDWGIYVGDPSSEINTFLTDSANDDAANPYDIYSLNQTGYVTGGSQQASEYVGTQVFFYSYGFALDDTFNLVPTEDEANPYQRLLAVDMQPGDEGQQAARGVYYVRSALYIWQAKPLLLGTQ